MKKLFFIAFSILTVTTTSMLAQKPNVMKAKSLAFSVESPNIEGAKEIIQDAIVNEETKDLARTWFVAAEVYLQAAKVATGENVDIAIGKDALLAYEYLLKAHELDLSPNLKGKIKPKYTSKISDKLVNEIYKRYSLVNYGVKEAELENFSNTVAVFKKHTGIANLPIVAESKNPIEKDSAYLEIRFFTAQYAWAGEMTKDAIEIYSSLKNKNYKENAVYQSLASLYREDKDTVNYVATLKEGIEKFPNEFFFLGNLINYYAVDINQPKMAKEYVEKAIANDPNNAQYYVVLGGIYEVSKEIDQAIICMDKALEIDPKNHEAWNGKGRLIYNKAVEIDSKAGMERDIKKSDALIAEAKVYYKESIPFFEKAVELNKDNYEYLKNLRGLYYRFIYEDKLYEAKYQAVDKLIKGN